MRWQLWLRAWQRHRVVVVLLLQGRKGSRWLSISALHLLLLLTALCGLHDLRGTVLVRGVVKERANVVHEQWVKKLSDLLLVCKVQCPLKGNPAMTSKPQNSTTWQRVSRTYQTPFRCIGPIFTTWRVFSLLRIPSRRPLVMPATFNSLVPLIMWLSANHVSSSLSHRLYDQKQPTLSTCDTNTPCFNLEAQAALVFP